MTRPELCIDWRESAWSSSKSWDWKSLSQGCWSGLLGECGVEAGQGSAPSQLVLKCCQAISPPWICFLKAFFFFFCIVTMGFLKELQAELWSTDSFSTPLNLFFSKAGEFQNDYWYNVGFGWSVLLIHAVIEQSPLLLPCRPIDPRLVKHAGKQPLPEHSALFPLAFCCPKLPALSSASLTLVVFAPALPSSAGKKSAATPLAQQPWIISWSLRVSWQFLCPCWSLFLFSCVTKLDCCPWPQLLCSEQGPSPSSLITKKT